jgi:hypothetical protein
VIVDRSSSDVATYNSDLNRYSLNTTVPAVTSDSTGDPLVSINWNCNSWDFHKSLKSAKLANTMKADVILITDTTLSQPTHLAT